MLGAVIMEPFGIYILSWLAYFIQHGVLKFIHVVAHARIFFFSHFPSLFFWCKCVLHVWAQECAGAWESGQVPQRPEVDAGNHLLALFHVIPLFALFLKLNHISLIWLVLLAILLWIPSVSTF